MQSRLFPGEKTVNIFRPSYKALYALYPDKNLRHFELSSQAGINKGNLSKLLGALKTEHLVEEKQENGVRLFALTEKARTIVKVLIETEGPEKPRWKPTPEEVTLFLNALRGRENLEIVKAAGIELSSALKYGYWDSQLEEYFAVALSDPANYSNEIKRLLRSALHENKGLINFLSRNRDLLFELASQQIEASIALEIYLKLSGDKALKKLSDALNGDSALKIMDALRLNSVLFYQQFGLKAKQVLYEALKHSVKEVRELARLAIEEISSGPTH